ncbi:TatD family hydrolase [Endozoicomonas sp. SCSIO W0465]|uniref:TatD family hydrolase n=1 Tax=Endozoicomonas sp. SCSIO W0465 TaxID=2918516 RepID=UPI0020756B3E|nr:TatD family hydrolase [Endozoicomonas sp. SCSIO W0465]USE33783.1 TatD family hydrolase [Endozoicomonas sp. SCSIO W0465]
MYPANVRSSHFVHLDHHREDVHNAGHHSDGDDSGEGWQVVGGSGKRKGKKKSHSGSAGKSVAGYSSSAARYHVNPRSGRVQGQKTVVEKGLQLRCCQPSTPARLPVTDYARGDDSTARQLTAVQGKNKVKLTPLATRPRYETPLIDIGANLVGNNRFHDLPGMVADAARSGVRTIIITGSSIPVSRAAHNEVMKWENSSPVPTRVTDHLTDNGAFSESSRCSLYYTVGCHPHHAKDFTWHGGIPAMKNILEEDHSSCIAVGECGLDYHRMFSPVEDQKDVFRKQLAVAVEMKKPLFLHERDAHDDFMEILGDYIEQLPAKNMACVHCFTGNDKALHNYIDLGCSIGITGWIAGSRNRELVEALRSIGWDVLRDRLMVETDAPFLLPFQVMSRKDTPGKGNQKRVNNVPANLPYVIHALSLVLDVDAEEIAAATTRNARNIFSLPD